MNKFKVTITGILVVCLGIGVVSAQNSGGVAPAAKQAPAMKSAPKAKAANPAPAAKKAAPTPGKTEAKPGQHLKKDGTPDKRYKENKAPKPATSPASKAAAPKKTAPKKAAAGASGM